MGSHRTFSFALVRHVHCGSTLSLLHPLGTVGGENGQRMWDVSQTCAPDPTSLDAHASKRREWLAEERYGAETEMAMDAEPTFPSESVALSVMV